MKKVLLVVLALVCVLGLTACDAIGSIFDNEPLIREFELTFDYLDGSTSSITTSGNEVIVLPIEPIREGYTFGGWYFDKDTWTKQLNDDTLLINPIFHNKTVYAKWTVKDDDSQLDLTYRIQFDTKGGTPVATINTNRIVSSPKTTLEGYTFLGWFLYETSTQSITFPYVPNNDITLYAKWKENAIDIELTEYTVSFAKGDEAGGEITGETPASQKIVRNRELFLPANPFTKADHDFIGWSDGQGIYAVGEAFTVTADVTFTARWRIRVAPPAYTLSFGPGEGEGIIGTSPAAANYEAFEQIILPANPFTRNGYLFVGWYDALQNEVYQAETVYTTVSRPTTLVARWQLIEYSIIYHNLTGAANAVSNPTAYTFNTPTFTIADPLMSGYSFEGWYADDKFTTPATITITKGSTGIKSFYALWKRIELSKQLNAQGNYVITGYTSNSSEIIVPEKLDNIPVTEIAAGAFRNNTTLITLIIPSSVTRIGSGIVNGCHNLTNLTIPFVGEFAAGNTARNSVLGYLYGEVSLTEPGAVIQNYVDTPAVGYAINSKLKNVTITSANAVPTAAFQNISSLQKVILNKDISVINQLAFSGCSSLTEVDFGAQHTITSIGAGAFAGCNKLNTFSVPNTVTNIGANCFASSGIVTLTIPQSVTEIGQGMLANTNIATLTVPYIGKSRFYTADAEGVLGYFFATSASGIIQYLSDTTTATYNIPASLTTLTITDATRLMYGALSNCTSIRNLSLGNSLTIINPYALYNTGISGILLFSGLTTIGAYSFAQNKLLTTISVPSSVSALGNGAFRDCTALTTVTFHSGSRLTAIPESGFRGCTSLSSLTLQDGIRVFGDYSFQGCTMLPLVNISTFTTTIGAYAFADCVSLSSGRPNNEQVIIIPASTTIIGNNAFENCASIKELNFTAGALTTIGNYAFANCTGIGATESGIKRTTIVIPNNVTAIGNYAFYNCNNIARLDLNKVTAKLTTIGEYAFANWTALGSNFEGESTIYKLEIPATVTVIGANAFQNAINLRQLSLEGSKLTSIGDYAFAGASVFGLNLGGTVNENYSLNIPDSVTIIGAYAFAGSAGAPNSVRNISFSQDSNLTYIGNYAFAYCAEITQINIGRNVQNIGEGALRGTARLSNIEVSVNNLNFQSVGHSLYNRVGSSATALIKYATGRTETSFTVPLGVVEIGSFAFETDTKLERITLPSSVKLIHKNAFEGSTAEIVFDRPTITTLGAYAFNGYLRNTINLPNTLVTLSNYALAGAAFQSITIPQSVTSIGAYVFAGTPVYEVNISQSVTSISAAAFAGCNTLVSIKVDARNSMYRSLDGVLYQISAHGAILLQYPAAKLGAQYTVPADVTTIKANAFEGATNITTLIIPNTVTSIEAGALYGLDSLKFITLPFVGLAVSSPTTLGAMFGAVSQNTTGAIRQGAAYYKVPSALTFVTLTNAYTLANYAFQNINLASVYLGNLVQSIGIYAFENCTAEVIFGAESTISTIDNYAFAGFSGTSFILPISVLTIGDYAFSNAKITEIVFGANSALKYIGQYAFAESKLTTLTLPRDIISIGKSALEGVGNLNELALPFIGISAEDKDNTLAYLFGSYIEPFNGSKAQTKRNGVTFYSLIPNIQKLILTQATAVPVGAFMNVDANSIILESVSLIGENAFAGCIAEVKFGQSSILTEIGVNTFRNYAYNGEFVVPDSVITISQNAFYGTALNNIVFGAASNLTTIENYAFAYSSNLGVTTINYTLPNSLTVIGDGAFYSTGIKAVLIPKNVMAIGDFAFGICYGLAEIKVDTDNLNYKDINGVLYSKSGETLLQYPANYRVTAVTIPAGVKTISSYAFAGNTAITSVSIPTSVTLIEEYAFAGSQEQPMNITEITFLGASQLKTINNFAFAFCTNLMSITIPRSVEEIREGAFAGNALAPMKLKTLKFSEGSSLLTIGDNAFAYCTQIESIAVPQSIMSIGESILKGANSLESLIMPYIGASRNATGKNAILGYLFGESLSTTDGSTMQYYSATEYGYFNIPLSLNTVTLTNASNISYGAFYNCGTIEWINLNAEILDINAYAFYACTSIRTITIPNRVTTIGAYAFAGTNYRPMSLETVSISASNSLYEIGEGAFYNCSSLTEFFLPQSVTNIARNTFYNSINLKQFTLATGSRLVSIEDYAFFNSGLESLTVSSDFRTIGKSAFENSAIASFAIMQGNYRMTSIGDRAFAGCYNLTSFFVPGSLLVNGMGNRVFYDCISLTEVVFGNGSLADLGEYAFYNCYSLESINLPNALTAIRDYQFYGCRSLININIPASVKSIGAYAFAGKDGVSMKLQSVTFSGVSTLVSIGTYAFNLCYSLTSVQIPDSLVSIAERAFYNCNKLTLLQISPNSMLQNIGDYAFSGCVGLSEIYIPQNVSVIGTGAFRSTGLTQINVDENNDCFMSHEGNLLSKDGKRFIKYASANARTAYQLPATVTSISEYAFADSINLKSVDLPDGLLTIEGYAFSASGLTSFSLPQTVYSIGSYAFTKMTSLTAFVFEGNSQLVSLGSYAFFNCTSLIEIIMPAGLTIIPDSLFYGCTSLFKVGMGYITDIGKSAFYGAVRLTQIILPTTLVTIGDYAFYNCASLISFTAGASLTTIGVGAFSGCESLTKFEVNPENQYYASSNGVLYTKNYNELLIYPAGKTDATYIINSRTTRISAYAFLSAKHLKSISLPSRISYIGYRAFYGATSLVIYAQANAKPNGWDNAWNLSCPVYWNVTVNNYGTDYQFVFDSDGNAIITRYLGSSASFTFPTYVELVDSVENIPVIGIGSGAMLGLDFVHSVLIPQSITYIGERAFDNNARLTIYSQAPAPRDGWHANWNAANRPVYWSVNAIHTHNNNFEYIIVNSSNVTITRYIGTSLTPVIPTFIESISVTRIGSHAFSGSNITGITLPENLHTIEAYAFAYCQSLTSISIPNKVRNINNHAFAYCTSLSIANIAPDGGTLSTIGWNAFTGCSRLEQIIIPQTITTIGGQVFKDCGNNLIIIVKHNLISEPETTPLGFNNLWNLKGYVNGEARYYAFIWQRA